MSSKKSLYLHRFHFILSVWQQGDRRRETVDRNAYRSLLSPGLRSAVSGRNNTFLPYLFILFVFFSFTPGFQSVSQAQGVAQVTVTGVPPVLTSPSIAGQVQNYDQGRFTLQFFLSTPDARAREFRFHVQLEREGSLLLDVTSEPVALQQGVHTWQNFEDPPAILFQQTLSDVIEQLNAALQDQVSQTGFLAEGVYTLTVEAVPEDPATFISTVPAVVTFEVIFPEPPVIISPLNDELISPQFPIFSWTPVTGVPPGSTIEYELLMVEVWPGQSPYEAIQGARPHVQTVLTNQTVFSYGADQLPLEPGHTYAWQVTASGFMDQIPFRDEGRTEIHTFTVTDQSGGIPGPFTWKYPTQDPFLQFFIPDASVSANSVTIEGRYQGQIGEQGSGATFDGLIVDPLTGLIAGGEVTLDRSIGFAASIEPQNGGLSGFQTQPPGGSLTAPSGVLFQPGMLVVSQEGIRPLGQGGAALHYGQMSLENLTTFFSPDFLMDSGLVGIISGRMDLLLGSEVVAYVDASGFHLGQVDEINPVMALPERLPLPSGDIAYIRLREGTTPFVDVSLTEQGRLAVSPLPGEPVHAVFAALAGNPKIPVNLQNILIDPNTGKLISGTVTLNDAASDTEALLTDRGIPLRLSELRYDPLTGLQLGGDLVLFGQTFAAGQPLVFEVDETGNMKGFVSLENMSVGIPVVPGSDKVVLNVNAITGNLDIALLNPSNPFYELTVESNFRIRGQGQTAAEASVMFSYGTGGQFRLLSIGPGTAPAVPIALDGPELQINEITSLDLSYTQATGFDFTARLNAGLRLQPNGDPLIVPMSGIELRNTGFFIPSQNVHEGLPEFDVDPITLGPLELQLLAMRLSGAAFDWYNWQPGTPTGLDFRFDFEVSFPGFRGTTAGLGYASVTLQDAGLDGRFLTGDLLTYTLPGQGAFVPFTSTAGMNVSRVEGRLFRNGDEQGFDINMTARLHAPGLFSGSDPSCTSPEFTVNLAGPNWFEGRAEGLPLCQTADLGGLDMTFSGGYIDFSYADNGQQVVMGGNVDVSSGAGWLTNVSGSGTAAWNMVSGMLTEADISLQNLGWAYPAGSGLFQFSVAQAQLTPEGLVITDAGTLNFPNSTAPVTYNNLALRLSDGQIVSGEVEFQQEFGLQIGLNPVQWSVVDKTELADDDENTALLVLPPALTLDQNGLAVTGTHTAHVNALGVVEENLSAEFQNFLFGFTPAGVKNGLAELMKGQERVAVIDHDGLHLDNPMAAAPLPARLPLPGENVAYIELTDSTGAPLVELAGSGAGSSQTLRTLPGETTRLVLASLGQPGAHPEVDLTFELQVNPLTYQITGGTVDIDLSNNPLPLAGYGFPLELTRILFSDDGGGFKLKADARIKLPDGIPGLAVDMGTMLTFSDDGFESAVIDNGRYSLTQLSDAGDVAPLASTSVSDGALGINVRGYRLEIGDNNSFKISGDLVSNILKDTDGNPAPIHYAARYQENDNNWLFTPDVSHLPDGKLPLLQAEFQQEPNKPITLEVSDAKFGLALSGVITLPDLSDSFSLTVDSLYIGSDGVEISSSASAQQSFTLFGGFLTLNTSQLGISYNNADNIVYFNMDGTMVTKIQQEQSSGPDSAPQNDEEPIAFTDLTIGTDGSFSLGGGQANLLADHTIQVLPDIFWLTEMGIGYREEEIVLSMEGMVELPVPGEETESTTQQDPIRSDVNLAINTKGELVEALSLDFIFDPNAMPKLGNNTATEFQFGDIATFELTGAALDFDVMNPVNTAFYATAAVHIHSGEGSTSGANKDENGKTRVIMLGNASSITDDPGIIYHFQDGLEFILDVQTSESNPLFAFDAGLFNLGVTSVYMPDVTNFEVAIGGVAGMTLDGVSGSFGFEGFTFGTQGVTDWGGPSGSFSLSLMNVVSLELGEFDYEKAASGESIDLQQTQRVSNSDGTESDSTYTIEVREYMLFEGAQISLGGAGEFSGGVEKVLYYEGLNGEIYLSIEDAGFNMGDTAELVANLEFLTDNTGFMLRVSGVGRVKTIAMGAVGKISTLNDQLSFGIFLAATGAQIDLFPIVPNTIILTGAGGGFFYRPEQEDLQAVVNVLTEMTQGSFQANNPNGFPEADGMLFAVMLYADVGLVGTSAGGFAARGNALITVTDQFGSIDMNGILIRQDGEGNSLGTMRAGMYLTVKWPTPQDTGFLIQGGVSVDVKYMTGFEIVTGNLSVDMYLVKEEGDPNVVWAVIGNADIEILTLFEMHGDLFISSDGLLVSLTAQTNLKAGIVNIAGRMELAFWYYTTTGDVGVYTEAAVSAKVDIKVTELEVGLYIKGALVVEGSGGYLVYAEGGILIDVGVDTFNISLWVALRDGDLDGGTGSNESYEQMIADSRNQVNQLRDKVTQLQTDINSARLASFEINQATIDQAGMKIRTSSPATRRKYADLALTIERDYRLPGRPLPQAYVQAAEDYIASPGQPDHKEEIKQAFDAMQQAIETLDQHAAIASQRVQQIEFSYAQLQEQPGGDISSLQNPVSMVDSTGFTINQQVAEQQTQLLFSAHQETQERMERYRQSIQTGAENIRLLTSLMKGEEGIAPLLPAFKDAYEAFGRYYALAISSHYEALAWASRITRVNQSNFDIIFDDLEYVTSSFVTGMEPESFNIDITDPNNLRIARDLAAERYSLIKQLASSGDSLLTQTDLYDQDYESYKQTLEELHWQKTWFEAAEKGLNFWFDVISASIHPYMLWHSDQIKQLTPEYQEMVWDRFVNSYRKATSSLGQLYPIKSKMIETQVAMIDEFLQWGGDRLDPAEVERLSEERQQWALMLEPPRITSLTVTPERIGYYNKAQIEWEAEHPAGEISESIIRLKSQAFLTLGKEQSITHYAFQDNDFKQSTDNLSIELAVRGPGGTLFLTESDQIELSIAPGGDTGGGVIIEPDTPVLPDNAYEPPTSPEIVMPRGEGPNGYWVSDPNRLDFMVSSFDPAGSQLLFEAAIGTGGQTDNIKSWAPLPDGVRPAQIVDEYLITIWQEVTGYQLEVNAGENQQAITMTGLNMQPDETYTLSVRAVNGYKQSSDTTQLHFRLDDTSPVFASGSGTVSKPEEVTLPPVFKYGGGTSAAANRPEVITPFEELEQILSETRVPVATPVRLSWPAATDEESGIYRYSYLLSYEQDPQIAFSGADGVAISTSSTQGEYQAVQYKEPWYVHVQAMSYSGTTGWFTYGPFDPLPDASRPYFPQTRVGYYEGDLVLWITSFGHDIESGIDGYQYAVGTLPNAWDSGADGVVNLRDWPGGSEIQLPAEQYDIPPEGNLAPGYYLDPTGVESANPIYVYTRSVNSQGAVSSAFPSGGGTFDVVDITPPLTGEIETDYFKADYSFNPPREERLYLRLMDVTDPGSGIKEYSVTVTDNQTSEEVFSFAGEFETPAYRQNAGFLPADWSIAEGDQPLLGRSLHIRYNVTNGAGLASEAVATLDLTVPPPATPGLRARVLTLGRPQPTIFMQMGNIDGYEAGISLIEYRVEDNETNEELLPWTDTGLASETDKLLDGPYYFEWYVPGDEFGDRPLRIDLRVTTGLGEQATTTEIAAY